MGELDDGSDPAMSVAVATERSSGVQVDFSGLVHPDGSPTEQCRTAFEVVEDVLVNDLDGSMNDVTVLRFYVRDAVLDGDLREDLHAVRREFFESPEYPAATMIGVSSLVHDDAHVEVEAEAFVPGEEWSVETVLPGGVVGRRSAGPPQVLSVRLPRGSLLRTPVRSLAPASVVGRRARRGGRPPRSSTCRATATRARRSRRPRRRRRRPTRSPPCRSRTRTPPRR
ncbi:Rid family hydrolase [Halobaculum litoreum]|uniref:Rid family hydrolase n=1 Tax=Halobaculum litoreum TaxID=3031998 RepID=UPI0026E553BC|nr:Rid family hydrolase [Halobaculum sp. DT92]